jgi:uncharacterized damage-inducible protein DinB
MITQTKWIERRFNFDFPVGMMPVIIERLRGTHSRIEALAAGLSHEILIARVSEKWSIQEHIGHLIDVDELHDGRIDDFVARKLELRAADMTNARTSSARHNGRDIRELIGEFRKRRSKFIARVEELNGGDAERISLHPRLRQPMRLVDMLFFVAEHDDHHLALVRNNIRSLSPQ